MAAVHALLLATTARLTTASSAAEPPGPRWGCAGAGVRGVAVQGREIVGTSVGDAGSRRTGVALRTAARATAVDVGGRGVAVGGAAVGVDDAAGRVAVTVAGGIVGTAGSPAGTAD
ncbi:MAG: hypothetical protein NVSMB65_13040 [Chloroflexota bacterium]